MGMRMYMSQLATSSTTKTKMKKFMWLIPFTFLGIVGLNSCYIAFMMPQNRAEEPSSFSTLLADVALSLACIMILAEHFFQKNKSKRVYIGIGQEKRLPKSVYTYEGNHWHSKISYNGLSLEIDRYQGLSLIQVAKLSRNICAYNDLQLFIKDYFSEIYQPTIKELIPIYTKT